MKIYLAGPMTGLPDFNYPAFNRAAEKFREQGHTIFNPAENFGGDDSRSRREYMRADLEMLLQADTIALLPGWRESHGARYELLTAQNLGLRTFDARYRYLIEIEPPRVRMVLGDAL